jgi:hypothetical protein
MAYFFMNYFLSHCVMIFLTQTQNWINGSQWKLDDLNIEGDNFYFNE